MKIASVILLCLTSIGFFNAYPRYLPIGPELLRNPQMQDDLAAWHVPQRQVRPIDGGGLTLSAADGNGMVAVGQSVSSDFPGSLVLLRCEMRSANVVNGIRDWETARVVLVSHDRSGKPMYQRPHLLAALSGSHDWRQVEKVFAVDDEVASLEVAAQLVRSSGEFGVRGCSLRPVMLKTAFLQYRALLLGAWLAAVVWLAIPLLRASLKSWRHAVVLALIFGILLGVLSPQDIKTAFGDAIWPSDNMPAQAFAVSQAMDTQFFSLRIEPLKPDLFKLGHFMMFMLLALALKLSRTFQISTAGILGYLLLLAAASEVWQLFIPGRSSQLMDVAIDMGGALCGLLLVVINLAFAKIALRSKWDTKKPRLDTANPDHP